MLPGAPDVGGRAELKLADRKTHQPTVLGAELAGGQNLGLGTNEAGL